MRCDVVVQGCDASVLLKPTDANPHPEMLGIPNRSLRGFEVIDAAKAALEQKLIPGRRVLRRQQRRDDRLQDARGPLRRERL
jgi:hypothetical protein